MWKNNSRNYSFKGLQICRKWLQHANHNAFWSCRWVCGKHFQYLLLCMQINFTEWYFFSLTATAVIGTSANVSAAAYSAKVTTWHNHQIACLYNYEQNRGIWMRKVVKVSDLHTDIKPMYCCHWKQWLPSALLHKIKYFMTASFVMNYWWNKPFIRNYWQNRTMCKDLWSKDKYPHSVMLRITGIMAMKWLWTIYSDSNNTYVPECKWDALQLIPEIHTLTYVLKQAVTTSTALTIYGLFPHWRR